MFYKTGYLNGCKYSLTEIGINEITLWIFYYILSEIFVWINNNNEAGHC